MQTLRFFVLAVIALAFLSAPAAALDECTDFLTFQFQGAVKLPQDGFDYNTSILSMRVVSARPDGFRPGNVPHDFVYVTLADYLNKSTAGQVYYQTTQGKVPGNFYFSPLNASGVPWYCGDEKIEDLTLGVERLSGTFYGTDGKILESNNVLVVKIHTQFPDAFSLQDFGTTDTLYVIAEQNKTGLNPAYLLYDSGNGNYLESSFKNVRFRIPANQTAFCRGYSSFCLDERGIHVPACSDGDAESFYCKDNACQSNVTACAFGCDAAACLLESEATATPAASASVAPTVAPTSAPTTAPTAEPSVQPKGDGGFLVLGIVVLAALIGGGYYLFGMKRKKGL
ncbi:MAG: PT domain-containing protein [Candidatus Micrarchaeota archaeon]|nr:PT domain-containing protein [Candidatus Micrarchaeota archaeon]